MDSTGNGSSGSIFEKYNGAFVVSMMIVSAALFILCIIALWKVFEKAGEEGWKAIIPIYNTYIIFKISWDVKYFWIYLILMLISGLGTFLILISLVVSVVILIINIRLYYLLARSFGRDECFALGLIIFSPIFLLILGFSSDIKYEGNYNDSINGNGNDTGKKLGSNEDLV